MVFGQLMLNLSHAVYETATRQISQVFPTFYRRLGLLQAKPLIDSRPENPDIGKAMTSITEELRSLINRLL